MLEFKMVKAVLVSVLTMSLCVVVQAQNSCYAFNDNPYLQFSTKTAYQFTANKDGISPPPGCRPLQLWLMCRHGTRWPFEDQVDEFNSLPPLRDQVLYNYIANKTSLCSQDMENLKTWQVNFTADKAGLMTQQGREDLFLLGQRIRSYFSQFFNFSFAVEKFILRHTDTPRTKESAEFFARGVFGLGYNDTPPPIPDALPDDRLLDPSANCPAWQSQIHDNKHERRKFLNSEYMSRVVTGVSSRLGFDHNLTVDNVMTIYDGCRFQKAWNVNATSPWCAAFTEDDLLVLEYSYDVSEYYISGPGSSFNFACRLVKDLLERFSAVELHPQSNQPLAIFYFSHDTMLDFLSSKLQLNRDRLPLTADNYPEQRFRQFRTSHIAPFAGNILAVLYNCSNTDSLQIAFYQAEGIVDYPGCSAGLCDWGYIKQKFSSLVQNASCTDDSPCFNSGVLPSTNGALLTVLCLILSSLLLSSHC